MSGQLSRLANRLEGNLHSPGSPEYEHSTTPNNTTARQEPVAVAVVEGASDVAECVRFAADAGLRVMMQATGHGAAGSVGSETLLIDTRRLDNVEVDAERRVAKVGTGVRWGALQAVAEQHGLLGLSGTAPGVGVAGYTFYGGVGWLTRPYGLASATLRAVDFVDGHGELRRADEAHDLEALWAFRGGGGIGLATSIELDLFDVRSLAAGYVIWPAEHANEVFTAWGEATTRFGSALSTAASVLQLPDTPDAPGGLGGETVAYLGAATVDLAQSAGFAKLLEKLPPPSVNTFGPCDAERLSSIHLDPPVPVPSLGLGRWLTAEAGAHATDVLTAAGTEEGSPLVLVEMRHVGVSESEVYGALTNPPGDFLLQSVGEAPDEESRHAVESAHQALRNVSGPFDCGFDAAAFRVGHTTAPEALEAPLRERLRTIVSEYDPSGIFNVPRPLAQSAP